MEQQIIKISLSGAKELFLWILESLQTLKDNVSLLTPEVLDKINRYLLLINFS